MRLVPIVPFTAINYTAGLTGVRLRDYTLGTAVGIIPGTVANVALGTCGSTPGPGRSWCPPLRWSSSRSAGWS